MQKYTASVITAGCLWGLMGLFTRTLATYGVDSTGAIVLRCGIAALLFAVTLLVRDSKQFRIRLKDIWCFIGTGICSLLFFTYCYFQAITIMDLSTAAVLLYTAPSIVMILSLILFHERITVQKLIALVLAFAGCCLVSLVGGEHKLSTVGILYGLGAGFGYALYSIFARYALDRGYSSNTINFYSCLLTTIGAAIIWGAAQPLGVMIGSWKGFGLCTAPASSARRPPIWASPSSSPPSPSTPSAFSRASRRCSRCSPRISGRPALPMSPKRSLMPSPMPASSASRSRP